MAGGWPHPYHPRPMNRLNRYILWQCLSMMVFVTAALSAAVWLAQSLRLIDLIVNRGLSIELFLYLALLILPRFLDIVLPIGVFIAVLFTFNRLTAESELVVMRSSGLSHVALAKPVLMLAGIADSSPRLSRKTYLQGTVDGALQLGTMLIPVVLTARIGILKLSASGCTATAEFERVGPRRASSCPP